MDSLVKPFLELIFLLCQGKLTQEENSLGGESWAPTPGADSFPIHLQANHCYTSSLQYVTTPNLVDRDIADVVGLNPLCLVHLSRAINVEMQNTNPGSFHQQETLGIQDGLSYQFVAGY